MTLEQWKAAPDTPEAESLAARILTSLYTIAARQQGFEVEVRVSKIPKERSA